MSVAPLQNSHTCLSEERVPELMRMIWSPFKKQNKLSVVVRKQRHIFISVSEISLSDFKGQTDKLLRNTDAPVISFCKLERLQVPNV